MLFAFLFLVFGLVLGCDEEKSKPLPEHPASTVSQATAASASASGAPSAAPAGAAPGTMAEGSDADSADAAELGSASAEPTAKASASKSDAAPDKTAAKPKTGGTSDASKAKSAGGGEGSAKGASAGGADAGTADGGPLLHAAAPPTAAPATTGAAPPIAPSALPPPAPGSADEIASQVDAIFLGKKTFRARFKQEHTQKVSGVVKKSSGTVFVEKPNKLSFRYDPPNNNRIVSDGTTLKVYIAEDSQMFVQPVEKTEYPGALSFLMGNGLRPSFTFTINEKAKFEGGPVLLGKPRAPTPYYDYVMFYIDKALLAKSDPGVVRRVLIVDAQGNKNRFDFEDVSQPASIDAGEFVFTPPAGTNIQSEPKK
jgi:outer membrane lipoprotein-sorting protein